MPIKELHLLRYETPDTIYNLKVPANCRKEAKAAAVQYLRKEVGLLNVDPGQIRIGHKRCDG